MCLMVQKSQYLLTDWEFRLSTPDGFTSEIVAFYIVNKQNIYQKYDTFKC